MRVYENLIPQTDREVTTPYQPSCSGIDQTQFVALFVGQELPEADASGQRRRSYLRSPAHLTVTFFARICSVGEVDFSGAVL